MAVRFGTDGIRGRADAEVTYELAYQLGWAVARVLGATTFVGFDTRESSPILAEAVLAGLGAGGAPAVNLGYFTTPGVAYVAQSRAGAGVVVSASHNPYYDNGLKVLGVGGVKLARSVEVALEEAMAFAPTPGAPTGVLPPSDDSAEAQYLARLREIVDADLSGLRLVLDCAHGAASYVAEQLFRATGADVTVIHNEPNGRNINERAGSTEIARLVKVVHECRADLGLAFDGDADRLIAVDRQGLVRNGDDLLVLFALDRQLRDALDGGVVVTTMANLGVERALRRNSIEVAETEVGDRNVLVELEERGWQLGGEQSGHLIFRDVATTGDGLLTGLLLCELVTRRGDLYDLASGAWTPLPQAMVNVPRDSFDEAAARDYFARLRATMSLPEGDCRLVIRPSGTEPVVRVMVEAAEQSFVAAFIDALRSHFVLA